MRLRNWIALGGLLLAGFAPSMARADEWTRDLVSLALQRTDSRIALARDLLVESPNADTRAHWSSAHALQTQAHGYFNSAQYGLAGRTTLLARDRADGVIAQVRNLPDPDRVQQQVERTRDILDRAHDRLTSCDKDRAREMLTVAVAMQAKAETAVEESRYLAALQLTLSARERVVRAMRLCQMEESASDTATHAIRRTDDVISRAFESVEPSTPAAIRDQLARARVLQSQAQGEARMQHYDAALRLTLSARSLTQRAVRPVRHVRAPSGR